MVTLSFLLLDEVALVLLLAVALLSLRFYLSRQIFPVESFVTFFLAIF